MPSAPRRLALALPVLATLAVAVLAGCSAPTASAPGPAPTPSASPTPSLELGSCSPAYLTTVDAGRLTIGVVTPFREPFIVGEDPKDGQGYEAALGLAIGGALGFRPATVVWKPVEIDRADVQVPMDVDFVMGQLPIPQGDAINASYSSPYLSLRQVVVARADSPAAAATDPLQLADARIGALRASESSIEVARGIVARPAALSSLEKAESALRTGQVDAVVVDEIDAAALASQVPSVRALDILSPESATSLGLAFAPDNPLVGCVNAAIEGLSAEQVDAQIAERWLGDAVSHAS